MNQKVFLSLILFLSLLSCKNSIDTKYANEIQNQAINKIDKPIIQTQKIETADNFIKQYKEKLKKNLDDVNNERKTYMGRNFKDSELGMEIYNVNKELILEKDELFKVRYNSISICLHNQINDIKLHSSNPDIVSVDSFGNIKALSLGTSEITIFNDYQKSSFKVTVIENKTNYELLKINKSSDIASNFAFSTYYKNNKTNIFLLNIYDHKSGKIFSYPNMDFLEWDENREKVFVKIDTNIYSMNIDGTEKKKLNEIDLFLYPNVSISKDGKKIIFDSNYCKTHGNLFLNTLGSEDILPLIFNPDLNNEIYDKRYNTPIWSPKENKIIVKNPDFPETTVLTHLNQLNINSSNNLFLVDIDKLTIEPLINDNNSLSYLTWSPNGKKIIFQEWIDSAIKVMDLENKKASIIPTKDSYNPKFSSKGDKISFILRKNGQDDLYLINEDGSNTKELTQGLPILNYIWLPNGENIIILSDKNKIYQVNSESLDQKLVLDLLENDNKILKIY